MVKYTHIYIYTYTYIYIYIYIHIYKPISTSELHLLQPDPNRISHSHLCISLSYHVLRPCSTCKPQQKLKCSPRLRMRLVVAKGMSQDHRNQRASPAENPQALRPCRRLRSKNAAPSTLS